jgi:hypothetical protein
MFGRWEPLKKSQNISCSSVVITDSCFASDALTNEFSHRGNKQPMGQTQILHTRRF